MVSRNGMYRCHLVSRVLLKQFSKDGEVSVYDKLSNNWSQKKYIDVGFIYLPLKIFSSIEDEWERVETQVGNIFSKFENKPELYLKDKQSVGILKKFLCLHFTRSVVFFDLLPKYSMEQENELLNILLPEDRNKFILEWRREIISASPTLIKDTYIKIKNDMNQYTLELAVSNKAEFILGDMPVINFNYDNRGVEYIGIKNGVGYKASDTFMMPISPNHVLSLHANQNIFYLSKQDAWKINKMTRMVIEKEFYCKPA